MARRPRVQDASREGRDRLKSIGAVATRLPGGWRPRAEVIRSVEAVPTIFCQYDDMVGVGGHPISRLALVHGPNNEGKALSDETPVLTPRGWVPIAHLSIDDEVIGSSGKPTRIVGIYPQGVKQLFEVTFSDGASIECCGEHLWFTTTAKERNRGRYVRGPRPKRKRVATGLIGKGSVKNVELVAKTLAHDHAIPVVGAVEYESIGDLPIDPYVLGLLIGDGCLAHDSITFSKPENDLHLDLRMGLVGEDRTHRLDEMTSLVLGTETRRQLAKLELMGTHSWDKFIPLLYMRASVGERLALLRGLFDTDGSVDKDGGAIEWATSSERLADDVEELARSLGAIVHRSMREPWYTYKGERLKGRTSTRLKVVFNDGTVPVMSQKNTAKWNGRGKEQLRRIVSVVPTRMAPATCIAVDAPDCLYVAGRGFIVTHNTEFALGLGLSFLKRGHFFGLADAERTTTDEWVRGLMGEVADHPGFSALPVTTYEQVRLSVRQYCETIAEARAKRELPEDTTGLIVVDSIRKLVPKRLFDELAKGEPKKGEKGRRRKDQHVDGYGGRAAQLKAALNAAWVDELVPLLADTRMAMVIIARETPKANADSPFAGRDEEEVKVGGGEALRYDASLRLRLTRDWVRVEKQVVGERHVVELMKTKVANKDDSIPECAFHSSNGRLKGTPVGFDPVRDLVELGLDLDVLRLGGGGWIKFEGKNLGQGFESSLLKLYGDEARREAVELAVRAASAARWGG